MNFGKPDTKHMGWLWIKPHHFSQLHYDLEVVLLKIINNEKYLHRIHMIARKKKWTSLKQFLKQQTTRRNHMGTKWNNSGHWSVEHWSTPQDRLSFRLYFWDKENIHGNTWFGATKKTVQTYLLWPAFKRNALLPGELYSFETTYLF